MTILFKYYTDVKNCGNFRGFGFIYIYIYINKFGEFLKCIVWDIYFNLTMCIDLILNKSLLYKFPLTHFPSKKHC